MPKSQTDTAVLVVHGIGAQQRGDTLNKLLSGLRRAQRDAIPDPYEQGVKVNMGGTSTRFYEVYWADLLDAEVAFGTFQMQELYSLAWFPWFNSWRGDYQQGSYSWMTVIWWSLFLPLLNFFILFAYQGATLLAHIISDIKSIFQKKRIQHKQSFFNAIRKAAERPKGYSKVDQILDDFVGDVFNYVNSAACAFYRGPNQSPVPDELKNVYPQIVQRFYAQLLQAEADGCNNIQIVAHSLGTVITYHALSGLLLDLQGIDKISEIKTARAKIRHVYTIGSPLEKIRFFWPRLVTDKSPLGELHIKWDNFVSRFDPVAGVLKRFKEWGAVNNHHLLGGGFIRGHVVYEHNSVFIRELAKGISGQQLSLQRTSKEKWRDRLILIGETLLAPLALLVTVVIGMVIFAMVVLTLPYLLSLVLKIFWSEQIWVPVFYASIIAIATVMIIVMTLSPIIRASKVHRLYWRITRLMGDQRSED